MITNRTLNIRKKKNPYREEDNFPSRHHVVGSAIRIATRYPEKLLSLPKDVLHQNFYLEVIAKNERVIKNIPLNEITFEFCMKAIAINPYSIRYIPDAFKSQAIYIELIKNHPNKLHLIPENERSYDVYFEMIKQDQSKFINVLEDFKTVELCKTAISKGNGCNLLFVPIELQDMQMCMYAYQNGCPLYLIPSKIKNTFKFSRFIKHIAKLKAKAKNEEDLLD